MYKNLAVLNSDSINRKRIRFSVGALEDAVYRNCVDGIPSLLGHDGLQPIGWNFPFALYMEPGLTRLIGDYQIAQTDEEQQLINRAYTATVARRYQTECEPHVSSLEKITEGHRSHNGRYVGLGCAAYLDDEILNKIYPDLASITDSDGLIFLDDLLVRFQYLGQGIFKDRKQDISIFCHQYFRRSLSHINNFHLDFLHQFMKLQGKEDIKLRIALDRNLIGVASSFHLREELEYAWGPKYSEDVEKIRPGVTHYKCDERQKLFSGVSGMQFWWKNDENQKILEAEELRDDSTDGAKSDRYGCRYVHSIYDVKNKKFEHFDGAIRMYDTEGMVARLGKEINKAGKSSMYTKLFRIDGNLKLNDWKLLITLYYQGNPLTYEYFGMKQEFEKLFEGDHPADDKSIVEEWVPYRMETADGLRLFCSYHRPTNVSEEFERIIINPDTLTLKDGRYDVVEFHTLEIKKALKRMGHQLTVPVSVKFISPHDNCINFPTILHCASNLTENLKATMTAYQMILDCMKHQNPTIAMTLAWPLEDKEVRLSLFGKSIEIVGWIKANSNIPVDHSVFRTWVEQQSGWLGETYEANFNRHDLFDLISPDGVLFIHRKNVDPSWIKFKTNEKGELGYELKFPKEHETLFAAVTEGQLQAGVFYIVDGARCSKTNTDYFTSDTSKLMDEGVSAVITNCSSLGGFWTDTARIIRMQSK